ncbi:PCYCGC domain-containing protein [Paenibacillus hexagrammi]|uniref:PCYCGC domain-containing protein n=1 Tax=Paenibacillus hexagrammi TaxID=2908839 RepID=A0ABY3SFP4_9BACL|nr:PCYCGC domain-containing protein [Paenibacillus sp. YPD9-1]UJF32064.1 PCYCGC domain-containing protein [Paenibacillus sp. YPD9-1]
MKSKLFILITAFLLTLSACGSKQEASHDEHSTSQDHVHNDIQEKTASAYALPTFLNSQRDEIRLVYQLAGNATDIIKWIPCYCGCGESSRHKSNLNCFIKEMNADGSVVWDDHGTRCGVCLQIAVESVKMKQEGKSLKEIRTIIDNTYKKGYAKPTDTPMPI